MPAPMSADATAFARAIRRAQAVLAETIDPDTEMTLEEMLDALLGIFNDEELNARLARIEKCGGNGRDPPLE